MLKGHCTRSTISTCPVGGSGSIAIRTSPDGSHVLASLCGSAFLFNASVSILAIPKPEVVPTKLTLTVNGESATATATTTSVHITTPLTLPSQTALTISTKADQPMPKGWKMWVYHPGDVESPGNGVYYKVCETTTTESCEAVRKGRIGPSDDDVYAQLMSPTATLRYVQIDIKFLAP